MLWIGFEVKGDKFKIKHLFKNQIFLGVKNIKQLAKRYRLLVKQYFENITAKLDNDDKKKKNWRKIHIMTRD